MPKTLQSRLFFALIVAVLAGIIGRNLYHRRLRYSLDDALIAAVEAKNAARTRALLDSGVDANIRKPNAAPTRPGYPLLSLVIGAYKGEPPANAAGLSAEQEIACLLIRHGARVEDDPMGYHSYLQDACDCGSVPVVRCLLEHGANADYGSMYANAPLKHAIAYAQYADSAGKIGYAPTPEEKALRLRISRDMIALLRQHGARLTALQAVQMKDDALLREVLASGANVNEQRPGEKTALYTAVEQGDLPLMRTLLAHGADVNARPPREHTPLYCAHRHKNADILKLLVQAGAKEE